MLDTHTEKWRYYTDVRLWPVRAKLDAPGWISNFTDDEKPFALRLLDGFTYYSAQLVEQMFRATVANISQIVVRDRRNLSVAKSEWQRYLDSVKIVRVTGEQPSDADSGYIFTRLARDILQIREDQIVTSAEALDHLNSARGGNIVFVDDFVGSGSQFIATWHRQHAIRGGQNESFSTIERAIQGPASFFYCPILCTELGSAAIGVDCPPVIVKPAHFLTAKHSAIASSSFIWRDDMQLEGPRFVEMVSRRAGIPDLSGNPGCWRGFSSLGLAVAFEHGCPDATLPLFTWRSAEWTPLLSYQAV